MKGEGFGRPGIPSDFVEHCGQTESKIRGGVSGVVRNETDSMVLDTGWRAASDAARGGCGDNDRVGGRRARAARPAWAVGRLREASCGGERVGEELGEKRLALGA